MSEESKTPGTEERRKPLTIAGTPKKSGGGGIVSLLPIVVSVILALMLGWFIFPTKAEVTSVSNDMATLTATVQGNTNSIDALNPYKADVDMLKSEYAGLSSTYATKASVSALAGIPGNVSEQMAALESEMNIALSLLATSNLEFWLTTDNSTNLLLHILSNENATFLAEVTLHYTDPVMLGNTTVTYSNALKNFNGTGRDYTPALLWDPSTGWEYYTVTFHTNSFDVTAGVDSSNSTYIRNVYLLDCDTVSVKLVPSIKLGAGSGGTGGL